METYFEKNGYTLVKNALPEYVLQYAQINYDILEQAMLHYNPPTEDNLYPYLDNMCPANFSVYSPIFSDALLRFMRPVISEITGKNLVESYSYARTYYYASCLQIHKDRPSCEYSATVCIEKDIDWPIYFTDLNDKKVEIELNDGDLIVYQGTKLDHWRDLYTGKRHRQVFLHYVDANGEYARHHKFDGRDMLGLIK